MSGYGMLGHVMLAFQNSFGTALTTSLEAVAVTEAGLMHGIEQIVEEGMYGRMDESPYHAGIETNGGDIAAEASPLSIGYFLKGVAGYTETTSAATENTHIFKPRAADFDAFAACDPMTIQQFLDVGSAYQFSDMIGNTLNINVANGALMNITAGFIGGSYTRVAASTPTFPTAKPFRWDQASMQYNGAEILDMMDMTITINNNLEARYTLQNTSTPYKIKRTAPRVIEITGTLLFQAHSYQQAFEAQTEAPFVAHFAGSQAPNAITFEFPSFRFKTFEPTLAGGGLIEASFTAGAMFDVNSNTAMQTTLVNTQVGYLTPTLT